MHTRPCRIEPLARRHLSVAADVHRRSMPGYFLTNLGRRLLMMFYEDYLVSPLGVGFVAVDEETGQVVGVVVGSTDADAFAAWSNRRRLALKLLLTACRFFCCAALWRQAVSRVRPMLGSLLRRGTARNGSRPDGGRTVRAGVQTIAVVPEAQGTGVAADLMMAFEREMAARGVRRIVLSARPDNRRAIRFYEKNGWRRFAETAAGVYFEKDIASAGPAS